jgi:menaquinol-cytochrome c reductase iron-sulfur subunit
VARDRRDFLKIATCALGGGVVAAAGLPVLRLIVDPAGKTTVTSPTEPIDVGDAAGLRVGATPRRVEVVAPIVKDAWTSARDVVLGAAWLRRTSPTEIVALSAVCPHLGCAIGYDAGGDTFVCPCHDSKFATDGKVLAGPSKRAMDTLDLTVRDGRVLLAWKRFKADTPDREDA